MKNYIKDFIADKEIKINEKFNIEGQEGFNPYVFRSVWELIDVCGTKRDDILSALLSGRKRVVPPPLVLEFGKKYYYAGTDERIYNSNFFGSEQDFAFLECNNVFSSEDAARDGMKNVLRGLKL